MKRLETGAAMFLVDGGCYLTHFFAVTTVKRFALLGKIGEMRRNFVHFSACCHTCSLLLAVKLNLMEVVF